MRGAETVLASCFQASPHGVTGAPGQEHTGSTPGCRSFSTGWQANIFKSCNLLVLLYFQVGWKIYVCLHVIMLAFIFESVHLSISLPLCLFSHLLFLLFVCLFLCKFLQLSLCSYVCSFVPLFLHCFLPSYVICLFICLSYSLCPLPFIPTPVSCVPCPLSLVSELEVP